MLEQLKRRRSTSSTASCQVMYEYLPPWGDQSINGHLPHPPLSFFSHLTALSFFLSGITQHWILQNPSPTRQCNSGELHFALILWFFSHWKKKKRRRWKRTCFALHRRRRRCSSSQSILKQQFFLPNGAHLHQKDTKCNCFRKLKLGGLIQSPVLSPNLCLSLSPPINCIQIPHASTSEIWSNKMMVFYSSVSPMFILTGGHMSMQVLSPLNSEG